MELKKRYFIILLIIFLAVSVIINNRYKDEKFVSNEATYIFPKKTLKIIAFGYENIIADFYYIWMIQFFSENSINERLKYMIPIMESIAELDSKYLESFSVAGMIAAMQGKRVDIALQVLEIGMRYNPSEWTYPMEAGYYLRKSKQYKKAALYYDIAAHKKDSPKYLVRIFADMFKKAGNIYQSYKLWTIINKNAKSNYEKEVSYHHLYQLKVEIDRKRLYPIIEKFKQKYGRYPYDLQELYFKRFISYIPKDYDGDDYIYDNKSGKFNSRKRFLWK